MSAAPRRFRATSALPTTSTVFSTTSSSAPGSPSRRFKAISRTMPPFGLAPSIKARAGLSTRAAVALLSAAAAALFVAAGLGGGDDLVGQAGAARYSHAAAHFRRDLAPAQLEAYYREKAAEIDRGAANSVPDPRDFVITDGVSDPFFAKCMISTEHSVLHPSLRRGPDAKEITGRQFAKQPRDFDDTFATVDRRRYYFHPDRPAVQTVDALGAGLDTDLNDAIAVATAVAEKDAGGPLGEAAVPIAYMRTTRRDGAQTIVNVGGVVNSTVNGVSTLTKVRRIVAISRGYARPCEVSFVRPREVVRIHVLLAYSKRPNRLAAFLKMFAGYFRSAKTDLVRIVVSTTERERDAVVKAGKHFPELTAARFGVITSKGDEFGNFSRAVALREAVKTVPKDEVIFLSDADLAIGGNFLQNCRVNIVNGFQVWFPVMFSLYPYGKSLSSKDGLWRRSSYGMACMYAADFAAVGGFGGKEETAFTGWGSEDVFLYNRFRDSDRYAVLRTLEPGLQHLWHGKECERNEHYENCMRTVYMTIGSQDAIAKLMSEKRVDISALTKDAIPV